MVDLNEMLARCINFLIAWFLLLATGAAALGPTFFLTIFFVDKDYRTKCVARVIVAYGYARAFIERHRGE